MEPRFKLLRMVCRRWPHNRSMQRKLLRAISYLRNHSEVGWKIDRAISHVELRSAHQEIAL